MITSAEGPGHWLAVLRPVKFLLLNKTDETDTDACEDIHIFHSHTDMGWNKNSDHNLKMVSKVFRFLLATQT